jgi:hypothetical protein
MQRNTYEEWIIVNTGVVVIRLITSILEEMTDLEAASRAVTQV